MPTDDELRTYANDLPPIYRDVLAAFPAVDPDRKAGYGLAYQTLTAHFAERGPSYGLGQVKQACEQLAGAGFLEVKHGFFAHPTALGERLIAALTGRAAPAEQVPALPKPAW
jgi:hypothetical protein